MTIFFLKESLILPKDSLLYNVIADFLKVIFIKQAKFPAQKNCEWKCAGKAIKHRKNALTSVKSG